MTFTAWASHATSRVESWLAPSTASDDMRSMIYFRGPRHSCTMCLQFESVAGFCTAQNFLVSLSSPAHFASPPSPRRWFVSLAPRTSSLGSGWASTWTSLSAKTTVAWKTSVILCVPSRTACSFGRTCSRCVCGWVGVCARMCAYVYICACVCVYAGACVYVFVCEYVRLCARMLVCLCPLCVCSACLCSTVLILCLCLAGIAAC